MKWLPQRAVVGIAVAADAVRAVELSRGIVTWKNIVPLSDEHTLERTLGVLLAKLPRRRFLRRRAIAVVGPSRAQVRRIYGLPAVPNPRLRAAIVQQTTARHFLQNGVPLVTTGLQPSPEEAPWAGAIEEPVVHAIATACRARRLPLLAVAPTATVLRYAFTAGQIIWQEGDLCLVITTDGRSLQDYRRVLADTLSPADRTSAATLQRALQRLPDGAAFADAYSAAVAADTRHDDGLIVRPKRVRGAASVSMPRWRLALAATGCALTLFLCALTPGLVATVRQREATRQLRVLAAGSRAAVDGQRALKTRARLLAELTAFERSALSPTLFLASLTRAIEPPTMLVAVRYDSAAGLITALTPSAITLLVMLDSVPEIAAPTITGAVTPEQAIAAAVPIQTVNAPIVARQKQPDDPHDALQRVSVRFRWRSALTHSVPQAAR